MKKLEFRSHKGDYCAFTEESVIFANSKLEQARVFPLGSIKHLTTRFGVKLVAVNGEHFYLPFLYMRKKIKNRIKDFVESINGAIASAPKAEPYSTEIDEEKKQKLRDIGYVLKAEEDKFEKYYEYLVKLKKQGETVNLAVSDKLKINEDGTVNIIKIKTVEGNKVNLEEYNNPNLIQVGSYFFRNQVNFNEIQKQKLRDIGYVLKEDKKNNKKQKQEEFDKDSSFGKKKDEILNKKEHQHGK